MGKFLSSLLYKFIKFWVWLFYPKTKVKGTEHLPDGPAVIVGNHAKMNAPIACELYFPGTHYTWTAGEMMILKEVPEYAFQDFWSDKPRYNRWFFKLLSYFIAPFSVCVFNNANCIGVFHDTRLMSTFRTSVDMLEQGAYVIILPEHDVPHNNIVCEFQDRFIDVAKMHYRKTHEEISFVPMYTAPRLKSIYLGEPIRFDASAPIKEERQRISEYLMDEITRIARDLPEHTVLPYPNVPKKQYPSNKDTDVYDFHAVNKRKKK